MLPRLSLQGACSDEQAARAHLRSRECSGALCLSSCLQPSRCAIPQCASGAPFTPEGECCQRCPRDCRVSCCWCVRSATRGAVRNVSGD